MSNFWQQLSTPIFCLAPMEGVTDCAFREIFAKYGKSLMPSTSPALRASSPGLGEENKVDKSAFVMFTEFVNVDGLTHPEGFKRLKLDLEYTEAQRPIVAQIWGREPEKFHQAAKIIAGMGFDGIDINMGCPQEKEISQKTCAALIQEPELAGEIIQATLEGAKVHNSPSAYAKASADRQPPLTLRRGEECLPVSVKTRAGYSKAEEMEGWISHLLKYPLAALTIHARTKQEKSLVPARWEKIKEAVEIRDKMYPLDNNHAHTTLSVPPFDAKGGTSPPKGERNTVGLWPLIIGNGDIKNREEALRRIQETGCDGVMIGRGAFGNPWIFRVDNYRPTVKEKLGVMQEHAVLYEKMYKDAKSFAAMRKNFKAYASGFLGAHRLRAELMTCGNTEETKRIINSFLRHF